MKNVKRFKFEQNKAIINRQWEIIWNVVSVIFRGDCSLFRLCARGTLRSTVSQSFFLFFYLCNAVPCVCVSIVHVWSLLKCVNTDNTPYCPPNGCWDIAVLRLRCRKARNKKKMHKEKNPKWFELFPAGKRCRLTHEPCWNAQDTIWVKRKVFFVYSYNFLVSESTAVADRSTLHKNICAGDILPEQVMLL